MARIRSVHPDLLISETMAEVSDAGERLFVRLWLFCDDEGRCLDHPLLLKGQLFPMDESWPSSKVEQALGELAGKGLVIRYGVDGKRYLQVKPESWARYQRPNRPTPSRLPPPPSVGTTSRMGGQLTEGSLNGHGVLSEPSVDTHSGGEGRGDGVGEGECEGERPFGGPPAPPPATPLPRSRRTQVPEDFQPDEALRQWARQERPDIDLTVELPKFIDHHRSKASVFANHQLAFRNWLRNSRPEPTHASRNGQRASWEVPVIEP